MPDPLAVYVVKKVGWRKGQTALLYLAAWGLASEALGHPVTVAEYGDYWKQSPAKSYREREAFSLCWPELNGDPSSLWEKIRPKVAERKSRDLAALELVAVRL